MSQHFTSAATPAFTPAPSHTSATSSGYKPNNNMTMAAISILGCWPLAVVAMIYAGSVNNKWLAGDKAGANKAAARAKSWAIASWVVAGLLFMVILTAG